MPLPCKLAVLPTTAISENSVHEITVITVMAVGLETCTEEKQSSVIHFFSGKGVTAIEIRSRLSSSVAMQVCRSCKCKNGPGSSVIHSPRPGQAPESIAAVEGFLTRNNRMAVDERIGKFSPNLVYYSIA